MQKYDPYEHAEQLGITVLHRPIRTALGMWVPDHKIIVIRTGLRAVHDRSTLAHELGHAHYGHRDDREKHEVQADRYAATNLIDLDEFRALAEWAPDPHHMAQELRVSTRLVEVFLTLAG